MRGPLDFFRHASTEMLDAFFANVGAPAPPHETFRTLKAKIKWAEEAARSVGPDARHVFCAAIADVGALAGDLGAQCLRETVDARHPAMISQFKTLRSDYDRGIWIWVHGREIFDEALARWFFERRRPTGTWTDAFEVPIGAALIGDTFDLKGVLMPIVDQCDAGAPGVAIERYQLDGICGGNRRATLLSIFYEGRWNSKDRIKNGEVTALAERVVHQVAVQIVSDAGLMYVVGDTRSAKLRNAVAKAVAEVGLGLLGDLESLPRQKYNLQRLLDPGPFTWDPEHCIESVCVPSLTLWAPSYEATTQRTFSSGANCQDVRAQAIASLSVGELKLAKVIRGRLRVVFSPKAGRNRPRPITFDFNGPESITMNLDCAEQDLLRARYFDRWRITLPRRSGRTFAR
jgi:hypothetical protein